ncbi:MAG: tRNA pseudouridine(54/55) synthase Pus10 [Candidatus Helarchaeota archaeon]|nr:tRNA pseudouridine(54/55) synthase Pus10 [Candidatus Helarchaeota archaeon]
MKNEKPNLPTELMASIAQSARQLLMKYGLCDSCLGRQFALLGRNMTNSERGKSLKLYLTLTGSKLKEKEEDIEAIEFLKTLADHGAFQPAIATLKQFGIDVDSPTPCYICGGFMDKFDEFKELIQKRLAKLEFNTFLIGTRVPAGIIEREDNFRAEFNIEFGESIKAELNREIGKRLQTTEKEVSFESPDVVAVINPVSQEIELQVNPLFVYGRYKKLKRGISQTRWVCWNCEGEGCEECNGTGLRYEHSVEVFIAEPVLKAAGGTEYKFHGAGREDIDARMLGTGRPFVVEIKEPKKRLLDLKKLQNQINEFAEGNIEVMDLGWSDRVTIRNIKALAQVKEKTYRMLVETQDEITLEAAKQADEALTGAIIQQKTPQRVLHRRADKLRIKKVYEFKTTLKEPRKLEIVVRCQGGCYVKELVSGDEGRTQPNLSELLNTKLSVLELDVLDVAS